jgi:hypothetical protein
MQRIEYIKTKFKHQKEEVLKHKDKIDKIV